VELRRPREFAKDQRSHYTWLCVRRVDPLPLSWSAYCPCRPPACVQQFLLRHVYLDSQRALRLPPGAAIGLTFGVSILVHEAVLWGAFRGVTVRSGRWSRVWAVPGARKRGVLSLVGHA
jgi:hypothetical protein